VLDDPAAVVLGREPVLIGDAVVGYYLGRRYGATVRAEPVWDPDGTRVRC